MELSKEEAAVINIMRKGADVDLWLFESPNEDEAAESVSEVAELIGAAMDHVNLDGRVGWSARFIGKHRIQAISVTKQK